MAIWNLGSVNADMVYSLPHFPAPGETLAALSYDVFLGGKGANMSVAAARAGVRTYHIGAVGPDGGWAKERLSGFGVDTTYLEQTTVPTGHAIVMIDPTAENQIILYPGANRSLSPNQISEALAMAEPGDIFVTQNETNMQVEAARQASSLGLKVCYAAAPFDANAAQQILPFLDYLFLNEVEAEQLSEATGCEPQSLGIKDIIITLGARGARHINGETGACVDIPAIPVDPIDTTGAGDTFTGYVLAGLAGGGEIIPSMQMASRAAALMVTRKGTADVIPDLKEVLNSAI